MSDLEDMVTELKGQHTYIIYKRTLPPEVNKVVGQNFLTYEDALAFCKTMKLKVEEVYENDNKKVVYYEVLPDTDEWKNIYHNDKRITKVGNDKKKVARNYMDLED